MACMCGGCSSCMAAQGYNEAYEAAFEAAYDEVLAVLNKIKVAFPGTFMREDIPQLAEDLTELVMKHSQDKDTAEEAGYFRAIDRIERMYQTREELVKGLRGERMVTRNPVITDEREVALLKRVVRELEGNH